MRYDWILGVVLVLTVWLLWPRFVTTTIGAVLAYNGLYAIVRGELAIAGRVGPARVYEGWPAYLGGAILVVAGSAWMWFTWPR